MPFESDPGFSSCNHASPHRIEHNILRQFQEMTLAVHDNTLVPTLPQMADALMAVVKLLRIQAVQPPHAWHEMGFRRVDEHVIMIVHQTIRVASPPVLVNLPTQDGEKPIAVDRIEKDNFWALPRAVR